MTETAVAKVQTSVEVMERVVIGGDLSALKPAERVMYYRSVCESLGLNPLTKPFEYLSLNNKLVLYARKDCTDQLRKRDRVSITDVLPQQVGDLYVVTAKAVNSEGRMDSATGAVSIKNLGGDALANAIMKAETKAKRRVTLSLCGLGMLDETEVETVAEARRVTVDPETGEIKESSASPPTGGTSAPSRDDRVITDPQRKRLFAISREHGWTDDGLRPVLAEYGYESTRDIKMTDYEAVVNRIKAGPDGNGHGKAAG